MIKIKKIRADHVIDFAAEELKKYLRMMMPQCGDIAIVYEPDAADGFRLGLLSDFNLPSEAEDPVLDDVIHIDTDTCRISEGISVQCIEADREFRVGLEACSFFLCRKFGKYFISNK